MWWLYITLIIILIMIVMYILLRPRNSGSSGYQPPRSYREQAAREQPPRPYREQAVSDQPPRPYRRFKGPSDMEDKLTRDIMQVIDTEDPDLIRNRSAGSYSFDLVKRELLRKPKKGPFSASASPAYNSV